MKDDFLFSNIKLFQMIEYVKINFNFSNFIENHKLIPILILLFIPIKNHLNLKLTLKKRKEKRNLIILIVFSLSTKNGVIKLPTLGKCH